MEFDNKKHSLLFRIIHMKARSGGATKSKGANTFFTIRTKMLNLKMRKKKKNKTSCILCTVRLSQRSTLNVVH